MRVRPVWVAVVALLLSLVPSAAGGPADARVFPRYTFSAGSGGSILVHGAYPNVPSPCRFPVQPILHARYSGAIEVGKDDQGKLFVIGIVPFEDYLKGIGEVPRLWPMEALKAQVVAARSYALAHMNYPDPTGRALGYQLCATDYCQVFTGLGVANGPYGDRWRRAVDQTRDQVLLYGGRPADTLYFSTSNGHTLGNDQVFGTSRLPYLRPIVEHDDGGSPVSRWQTSVALSDLTRYLRAAGAWGRGSIASVSVHGSTVHVAGSGHSVNLGVSSFRNNVNAWAHCLDPGRYPTANATNGIRLPQTIPSIWLSASVRSGNVILTGRGWGHGVGLVQWGAEGKADRGWSYRQILAAYYGGLRPRTYAEPAGIRVGIATGLRSVIVSGNGPVVVGGAAVGPGPWLITGGRLLRIRRWSAPPTSIAAGTLSAPRRGRMGQVIRVEVSVPQLSVASLVLTRNGVDTPLARPATEQAGAHVFEAKIPKIETGAYSIEAVLTDGVDIVRTAPHRIRIAGVAPSPTPSPSPSPSPAPSVRSSGAHGSSGSIGTTIAVALGVAAILLVGTLLAIRRRRGRRRAAANEWMDG